MKIPRVTRTMHGSRVILKVVDKQNDMMIDYLDLLPRFYKTDAKLIKAVQSRLPENMLAVRVVENVPKKIFCQMKEDRYFDEAEKSIIE